MLQLRIAIVEQPINFEPLTCAVWVCGPQISFDQELVGNDMGRIAFDHAVEQGNGSVELAEFEPTTAEGHRCRKVAGAALEPLFEHVRGFGKPAEFAILFGQQQINARIRVVIPALSQLF